MRFGRVGVVAAAAVALAMSAGSAGAVTISIAFQDVGAGGAVTPLLTTPIGPGTGMAGGSSGGWSFSASGFGPPTNPALNLLDSNSIDARLSGTGAGGHLKIFVTSSDINFPIGPANFLTSFTQNRLEGGMTTVLSAFLSPSNTLFDITGPVLGSASFTGPITVATSTPGSSGAFNLAPLYAITEVYDITANNPGSSNATISTVAAVPGPLAGSGVPGLVAAFAALLGFGFLRRRRTTPICAA